MEAWDNDDKVRPIPIEDDDAADGFAPVPAPPTREHSSTQRPWIPLLVSSTAVALVVVTVSLLGGLRFDESPTTPPDAFTASDVDEEGSTTTATTIPPRLDEVLPDTTQRLTIIARNGDGLWALLWDPSFREPKAVPLDIPVDTTGGNGEVAIFDRGGTFVAVKACKETVCGVYVGTPTDLHKADEIPPSATFVWHATEVGKLAWAPFGAEGAQVTTATVNPLSGALTKQEPSLTLGAGEKLHRWDTQGFITTTNVGTTAYDPSGAVRWSHDGFQAQSATDLNVAMFDPLAGWQFVDRATGATVGIPDLSLNSADGFVWISTSESADLIARTVEGPTSTGLEIVGGPIAAKRIVTIEPGVVPLRFTEQGHYFVFVNNSATEMTFVDWARSASYRLELPADMSMVGFHLD